MSYNSVTLHYWLEPVPNHFTYTICVYSNIVYYFSATLLSLFVAIHQNPSQNQYRLLLRWKNTLSSPHPGPLQYLLYQCVNTQWAGGTICATPCHQGLNVTVNGWKQTLKEASPLNAHIDLKGESECLCIKNRTKSQQRHINSGKTFAL